MTADDVGKVTEYNPYYIAYAKAHGMTPDEISARDKQERGDMISYMEWIQGRWQEWAEQHGIKEIRSQTHGPAFERWLERQVWRYEQNQSGELHYTVFFENGKPRICHEAEWQIDKRGAGFIVQTLNSHNDLVEAAELISALVWGYCNQHPNERWKLEKFEDAIRAAGGKV
jgi:hypothetical protein